MPFLPSRPTLSLRPPSLPIYTFSIPQRPHAPPIDDIGRVIFAFAPSLARLICNLWPGVVGVSRSAPRSRLNRVVAPTPETIQISNPAPRRVP
ncbi:hypothetical protein N7510_003627 [Penicillium lagena]|uniref:uncharacterized protein n=1 Tax=Penicillium lagena TaxID=94218 RepID=UPI00254028B5|nr:uncharacterized protein N7510_003627 [Penicillium lagena]KAJ5619643.1 hypothetical protein N7510_003627 [Penicillium lagena]